MSPRKRTIGEMRTDSIAIFVVNAIEALTEMYNVFHASEENLAQRKPVYPREWRFGYGQIVNRLRHGYGMRRLQLRIVDREMTCNRLARCRDAKVKQVSGQTATEGTASVSIETNSVALVAEERGLVSFIYRDADTRFLEALCQAQSAKSRTDNKHMQAAAPVR
jgi:hypothetical protein